MKIIFWLIWGFCDLEGSLSFSVAVDGVVAEGFDVVGVRLVDYGFRVKPSKDSVLEFWSSWASSLERNSIFCISAFKKVMLTICW